VVVAEISSQHQAGMEYEQRSGRHQGIQIIGWRRRQGCHNEEASKRVSSAIRAEADAITSCIGRDKPIRLRISGGRGGGQAERKSLRRGAGCSKGGSFRESVVTKRVRALARLCLLDGEEKTPTQEHLCKGTQQFWR
jgi:hypothetical protein